MNENPETHNAVQDTQIENLQKDITEIKNDLKAFLSSYKDSCECNRKDIYGDINEIKLNVNTLQTRSGLIAVLATVATNVIVAVIAWFGFFKRMA